ncbi:MAG: carboxylesterase family protein [Salibacteraceae bacterium]
MISINSLIKNYTYKLVCFALLYIAPFSLFSQTRFFDPYFAVGVDYEIEYGKSFGLVGKSENLKLDIYQPLDDTLAQRPVIIFAHGGGYIIGNKNNFPMETLCSRFAQMGYVCVSINYSLGFPKKGDPNERAQKTVLMGVHDMKAAIRYLRATADSGNPYKLDPNMIWVGGSSAGAISALHAAFTDSSTIASFNFDVDQYGGIEGFGGNSSYSSEVQGVITLSGAIGDTNFIKSNIPVVGIHGTEDPIVPYKTGIINFNIRLPFQASVPKARVMGDYEIEKRLNNLNVSNYFLPIYNQGHCPFDRILDWKHYPIYMDQSINAVRNFMFNELWNDGPPIDDMKTVHTTTLSFERDGNLWRFYPVDKGLKKIKLFVFDENHNRIKSKKIKKKNKGFVWKSKKLPNIFTIDAVYNLYRSSWEFTN